VRGAFNKLVKVKDQRVIAASMGNHAQAVAYAAGKLGKHAVIVMPETASLVKQEATKGYGAEVVLHGEHFSDALNHALTRKDALFIHPFDDDDVIAGQSTVGLEIAGDLREVDTVLVPVGSVGAVTLAALLENADRFRGKRVVLVVSGGNIDFTLVDRIILKGLVTSHRIGVFSVVIDDVAEGLHAVTGVLGAQRANILDVAHARLDRGVPIGRTKVVFTVETRGRDHLNAVIAALRNKGYEVN
jgi:threonine dehydratase